MVAEAAESVDVVATESADAAVESADAAVELADAEEEIVMDSCHGARPYRHQVVNYESAEMMVVLAPSLET